MLTRIELENFKLHRYTKIEARPVTVFIGPNNSGKSSIFQALLLLRQAVLRRINVFLNPVPRQSTSEEQPFLYGADQQINVGTFHDIVHSGQKEINFKIVGEAYDADPKYGGQRELDLVLAFRDNQLSYHRGVLSVEGKLESQGRKLQWSWARGPVQGAVQQLTVDILNRTFNFGTADYPQFLQFAGISGQAFPDPAQAVELSALGNRIAQTPQDFLTTFHPVYPLRGLEEPGYPVTLGPEDSIDRTMLADRTLALLSILAYRSDVLDRVSSWLENLIGTRIRTKLVPQRRVTLICESTSRKTGGDLFSNEGTGAGQLPFILAPIALCPLGETLLISEPEAHLHPRAQSELARLFVRIALNEKKQFLIETHSEHVLNSLLHAVAKGELHKESLAIYYFEPTASEVSVRLLTIDDYGRVEGGLPGFFDQTLTELTDYLEALKRK